MTAEREQEWFSLPTDEYTPSGTSIDVDCPECGSTGRLFGFADADKDVDWDVEKVGDGEWEQTAIPYWQASLDPTTFACSVVARLLG